MHFLLTRPKADSDQLAQNLRTLGHRVHRESLLHITLHNNKVELDDFQAILFTSANGVRAFSPNTPDRTILCFTVGQATALEARKAGFPDVTSAGGNVDHLAALVVKTLDPAAGPLLHISGQDVAGNLSGTLDQAGFQVTRRRLYTATPATALSLETQELITSHCLTHMPFYSPRTAKSFVTLIHKAQLQDHLTRITALCLSSAVSDVIRSLSWKNILTAEQPDQLSLFNLIDIKLEENRP